MIIQSIGDLISGRNLYRIAPEATVREACQMLYARNIGALAVMTGDTLVGILSERDVIRRVIAKGRGTDDTPVSRVMSPDPVTIDTGATLAEAMGLMLDGGYRHLPVVRAGAVIAMVSMRDIPTEYRLMAERFREYSVRTPA